MWVSLTPVYPPPPLKPCSAPPHHSPDRLSSVLILKNTARQGGDHLLPNNPSTGMLHWIYHFSSAIFSLRIGFFQKNKTITNHLVVVSRVIFFVERNQDSIKYLYRYSVKFLGISFKPLVIN